MLKKQIFTEYSFEMIEVLLKKQANVHGVPQNMTVGK